ncbi:MAG: type I secretion protein TolC [Gammaproteobacteria bacterium]|nr:type I secretion protein TolC [Gammaproteobacteria bacterium]
MMKRAVIVMLGWLCTASAIKAEDLKSIYDRALNNDPQIRESDATRLATREARPQAWAALLPQITGSASKTESETAATGKFPQEIETSSGSGKFAVINFNSTSVSKPKIERWSLDLRQSVFSLQNWVGLQRASKQVAQAETDYHLAEQNLIQRVATSYFDVLAAKDTVDAQSSAFAAISRQLEQSAKRFEVGLIAITDVQEAKAARDSSAAAVIAAKRTLATKEELLREITGDSYDSLAKPSEDIVLKTPDPADASQWVARSMEQNLALISSRLAADIARDNVHSAFGGHLPSIDLVASKSNVDQNSPITFTSGNIGTRTNNSDDTTVQLQLSVPIFSSGATQSRVRQSQYQWRAARERLSRVSRQTERQARDAYLGVISEIARVTALRQALQSSRTALKATEAGYEVGTRTTVDVLEGRRSLVQAETNYSRSRYDYILNVLGLRLASGTLDRQVLEEVNALLTETTTLR